MGVVCSHPWPPSLLSHMQGVPSSSGGGAVPLGASGGFAAEDRGSSALEAGGAGAAAAGAESARRGQRVCDACYGTLRLIPTRKTLSL